MGGMASASVRGCGTFLAGGGYPLGLINGGYGQC